MDIKGELKIRILPIFFLIASSVALFGAIVLEYVLGFIPCQICIYQRWPYFLTVLFAIVMLARPKNFTLFFFLIIICLFFGVGLSVYHIGVENGIFSASDICSGSYNNVKSLDDLQKQIDSLQSLPSCDVAQKLFKIPISQINLIYSLFILVIGFMLKKIYGHKKD